MFAIVRIGNKQYKVTVDQEVLVDKIDAKPEEAVEFSEVLLVSDGKKTTVGKPFVTNASVSAVVKEQVQGEKINVRRFKAKVRYRRSTGFRPQLTRLVIRGITGA